MWNPVWHQAITRSFPDGRAFGAHKTIVFTVHTPVSGSCLRFCFSNRFGKADYHIAAMTAAVCGRRVRVTLDGNTSFPVPVNSCVFSDSIPLNVPAGSDLEIRMYWTEPIADCNMIEENATLLPGDQTQFDIRVMKRPLPASLLGAYNAVPALEEIDLLSTARARSIVAFGDSITALSRWTRPLAARLKQAFHGEYILLNSGISGNCLLYEPRGLFGPVFGEMGTKRFRRDVLDVPNLDTVIFGLGVNDAANYTEKTADLLGSAEYRQAVIYMADMLHDMHVRLVMQTITPRLGVARRMGRYTHAMEETRLAYNDWIRSAGIFDYLFDADAVVREKHADGWYYGEHLHQGDHLHPSAAGGQKLADAFDLSRLTGRNLS